jgi:hypothetical protein
MSDIPNAALRAHGPERDADRSAINRANSEKSTGPRTGAGKQRVRLNALRHGLTGQTVVLPSEDLSAYQRHAQRFLEQFRPVGALEDHFVQSLCDCSWRLNRVAAIETNLLSIGIADHENNLHANHPEADDALAMAGAFRDNVHAFSNIGMYCQRIARLFERTLVQLQRAQAERRKSEENALDQAADLLEMHQENDQLPYNPAQDGFVFSSGAIENFIQRRDRLSQARSASVERYAAGA